MIKQILSLNVPKTNISAIDLGSSDVIDVIKIFGSNLFNFEFGSEMIDSIKKRANLQGLRSVMMQMEIDGKLRIEENCD
jgi:hypothetical protein